MEIKKTDTSGKPRLPQEEPMRDRMKQPLKTKVKYPGSKVKIPVSERKGRNTFKASFKEVLKGGKEHKKFLDKKRVNRSSGGPIEVRDIDGDGKKEGWEIGRAKGMAKGMGKKVEMKKGGKVKKGYHRTKDGGVAKKGLYYYMNRAKKRGTSKPGKGSVTDKELRESAKTAKK